METVFIVGIGPGTCDYLLPAAQQAVYVCNTIVGFERQCRLFSESGKRMIVVESVEEAVNYALEHREVERVALLASGDPCLFSILESIRRRLSENEYTVIPGLSSFQLACARLKILWHDAVLVSVHGKPIEQIDRYAGENSTLIIFTDGKVPPAKIADRLLACGAGNRMAHLCENLGYQDERILSARLNVVSQQRSTALCVLIVEKENSTA